jgi:hypothetical protein
MKTPGLAVLSQGNFDAGAIINERGAPPFPVDAAGGVRWWIDDGAIAVDQPAFVGRVSDDGRFIGSVNFDGEQTPASQSSATNNKAPDITEESGVEWGLLAQSSR